MKRLLFIAAVATLLTTPPGAEALAESETMTVTANVNSVWTLTNQQMTFNFGDLTQAALDNAYTTQVWIDSNPALPNQYLGFSLRTNGDYQIAFGDIGKLAVDGVLLAQGLIETEYKLDVVDAHWYDNGCDDGPHNISGSFAPASTWRNAVVESLGANPGAQYWTGGFTGTFKWYPRFRPTGTGRDPGTYRDTWNLTVNIVPAGFTITQETSVP